MSLPNAFDVVRASRPDCDAIARLLAPLRHEPFLAGAALSSSKVLYHVSRTVGGVLVACRQARVVGASVVACAAEDETEARLAILFVHPSSRGAGLARWLLAESLRLAREAGRPILRADVPICRPTVDLLKFFTRRAGGPTYDTKTDLATFLFETHPGVSRAESQPPAGSHRGRPPHPHR